MNKYELTVVLTGKATAAKVKSVKEKVEKIVSVLKGEIVKTEEWGKLDLAFKLSGNDTGNFLFFNIELNPESVKALKDKIRVEEEIIRYLLIRK